MSEPCTGFRCPVQVGYNVKACKLGEKCPYYMPLDYLIENEIIHMMIRDFPIEMPYSERIQYMKDSFDKLISRLNMSGCINDKEEQE